ncbi:YceD family protein [Moraxella haemolytica]|uniref:YceD family protein n=1 Tax=Moraxella haemolytica TaxID=2904119 RepID=UPI0025429266|nr:YceD family protein [Moraxella sp. ZY171148]WII95583.1 YceD family protein [Moraxella sp. ZY171148]
MNKATNPSLDLANKEFPANIVLEKWADIGFVWSGEVAVASFERLSTHVNLTNQTRQHKNLTVQVNLQKTLGILWLTFDVVGELIVSCQRCLEDMNIDIINQYRLAILSHESQIEQVKDAEYVLVDEINGEGVRKMLPIQDLLEDELLLVLPLSPRHSECEMPIEMVDANDDDEMADNPFAALAALKGKLN